MIRFVFAVVALFAIIQWVVMGSGWITNLPTMSLAIGLSLAILTIAVVIYLRSIRTREKFLQLYLASIVVKLLTGCVLISVVILVDRSHAKPNVVFFLISYFLYTVVEVVFLLLPSRVRGV